PRGGRRGVLVSSVLTIAGYGFREALRRKVFVVVLVLTASFLALYWLANHYIFRDIAHVGPPAGIEPRPFAGAFIFGLAMFAALSLLGSVFLASTANGIAIFMIFGAGLVAGLLGEIGHALSSHTLEHAAKVAAWAIPFEALYQDGLREITANTTGLTGFLLQLGPFGGANTGGPWLRVWAVAYLLIVGTLAAL